MAVGATAFLHFDTTNTDTTVGNPPSPLDEADAEAGAGTIWTIGSGDDARAAPASGDYWGTFYGSTGTDMASVYARNDQTPTSAGGEFSSRFDAVGSMVGGLRCQQRDRRHTVELALS